MFKQLLIVLLFSNIYAKDIKPTHSFESVGFVNDFVLNSEKLYVANDMGTIDIFDIKTQKIINQILLPPLTSSMDKIVPADVLSVDYLDGKILILSVGKDSYRNVWIYENYMLKRIIDEDRKLTIKEARFVDSERIMLATLDSEITLHDIGENYNLYKTHVSQSAMGDVSLSDDKKSMIVADESGAVRLIDVSSSEILQTYSSQNVDNIYKAVFSNGVIITAGQDRRVGVYQKNQKPYYIKSDFLVFCVGISQDGEIGAYSSGENGDLQLFNTKSKKRYERLIGHKGVVNKIVFINKKEILSSQRGRKVLYWKIN